MTWNYSWYSVSKLIRPLRIKPVIPSNMQRLHSWTKIDYVVEADDAVNTGALQPTASSVLMQILHGARMARFDLLKAVANLAKGFAKWNANCDKRLHTLICYGNSSFDLSLVHLTNWLYLFTAMQISLGIKIHQNPLQEY